MARGRDGGRRRNRSEPADDDPLSDIPPPPGALPRRKKQKEVFQESKNGIGRIWSNYKLMLRTSFVRMSRFDQEQMLTKASVIVTIGVTILALSLFYSLIPPMVRVFLVPGAIAGAWWIGGKLVSQVIIARCEPFLNQSEY